ncbi:hypothetical protein [Clostridium hydrogeniformans]|uniref:hypothetical protein n=1 Tax=Clostridium hydrogeniformans TaxID=349933 RepID=UPI00048570A5|nr:hypothetical protein [Clostridium hydrogeniformans]
MISNTNTWIFHDKENNLWRFLLDEKGNMLYNTMYSHNRWSKETRLDRGVKEFNIYRDRNENIHIVYRNDSEVKYCRWDGKQWLGKPIYDINEEKIRNLKVIVLEGTIHVFFISNKDSEALGNIVHYKLSEDKGEVFTVASVSTNEVFDNYRIECKGKRNIYLLYIDKNEGDNEVKGALYNGQWSEAQAIYYTNGEDVRISTKFFNNKLYILNMSSNEGISSLEEIHLEENGDIKYDKIYNTKNTIDHICFVEKDNSLWALWNEEEKILYSTLMGKWSKPQELYIDEGNEVNFYSSTGVNLDNKEITCHRVFGSSYPTIKVILPKGDERNIIKGKSLDEVNGYKVGKNIESHDDIFGPKSYYNNNYEYADKINSIGTNPDMFYGNNNYEDNNIINEEVHKVKEKEKVSGKNSNKVIATLKMQLQQKEGLYEELQDRLETITLKSKKNEENIIEFKKIFEESGREMQEMRTSLEDAKKERNEAIKEGEDLTNEISKLIRERDELKENIRNLLTEYNIAKDKFQNTSMEIESFKDKLRETNRIKELMEEQINKDELKFNKEISVLTTKYKEIQDKLDAKVIDNKEIQNKLEGKNAEYRDIKSKFEENIIQYREIQSKLESKEKELEKVKLEKNNLDIKLSDILLENEKLKRTFNEGNIERESVLRELEFTNNHREDLKKALEDANKEIHMINSQKEKLISIVREANIEKNKLKKELELETNRSIISRIFNKKGDS